MGASRLKYIPCVHAKGDNPWAAEIDGAFVFMPTDTVFASTRHQTDETPATVFAPNAIPGLPSIMPFSAL